MKKLVVVSLALVLALSLVGAPVFAKSENAKGAVKADLVEFLGAHEAGPVVGSVVHNTTGDGYLIVVINMDDAPDLVDYDVRVWVNRVNENNYLSKDDFTDVLNTNTQGHGNSRVKVKLQVPPNYPNDYVTVVVVMRPQFDPNDSPCYQTEFSDDWDEGVKVPLK